MSKPQRGIAQMHVGILPGLSDFRRPVAETNWFGYDLVGGLV